MTRRKFWRLLTTEAIAIPVLGASLAAGLGACAQEVQVLYCGDEHRYVLEANKCDGTQPDAYIYHGYWTTDYRPGLQLNTSGMYSSDSGRVPANDRDARSRLGLPATGGFGGNGATFPGGAE